MSDQSDITGKSVGISFREVMSGGFALAETDPAAGKTRGRKEGTELTLHGSIRIDDIARFVAEPDHAGELSGAIDFTPFGDGLASTSGVFNLFRPTDDPKLKLMVYEMGFSHAGKDYYFAGQKNVRDDELFDLWRDTTTLYSTLHEGTDKNGPTIGAGVLTLGVRQLIDLIRTLEAPGTSSLGEKADALAKFGRFFLGELWDTYVKHAKV